jgi:hypothetical protein
MKLVKRGLAEFNRNKLILDDNLYLYIPKSSFLSCPDGDGYDSDSTGESNNNKIIKNRSVLEMFKNEFKFLKKASSKGTPNEFENLYSDAAFNLEERCEEFIKKKSFINTLSSFKEDVYIMLDDESTTLSDLTTTFNSSRKSSILRRLESNHSEKSTVTECK